MGTLTRHAVILQTVVEPFFAKCQNNAVFLHWQWRNWNQAVEISGGYHGALIGCEMLPFCCHWCRIYLGTWRWCWPEWRHLARENDSGQLIRISSHMIRFHQIWLKRKEEPDPLAPAGRMRRSYCPSKMSSRISFSISRKLVLSVDRKMEALQSNSVGFHSDWNRSVCRFNCRLKVYW